MSAIALADVAQLLTLFAQGIAGRVVHLVSDGLPAERSDATDGTAASLTIPLPETIDDFDSSRHNLGAYRVAVLHQIGFLAYGTYRFNLALASAHGLADPPDPTTRSGSRPEFMAYRRLDRMVGHTPHDAAPTASGHDLDLWFAQATTPALRRRVFNILEDARIDACVARDYPGACADLTRAFEQARARRSGPRGTPLAQALDRLVDETLTQTSNPTTIPHDGVARRSSDRAPATWSETVRHQVQIVRSPHADVYSSAAATLRLCSMLELWRKESASVLLASDDSKPPDPSPIGTLSALDPADGATGDPDVAEGAPGSSELGAPIAFRGELRAENAAHLGAAGATGPIESWGNSGHDSVASSMEASVDGAGEPRGPIARLRRPQRASDARATRSYLIDEWDMHEERYRRAWCRVLEFRLEGEDASLRAEVRRRHAELSRRIRQRFAAIRAATRRPVRGMPEGEELDLDRAIETLADRRAGIATERGLYVRRETAQREVAAAFLIDMSASTDFPVRSNQASDPSTRSQPPIPSDPYLWMYESEPEIQTQPRRRVIDVARDAIALMCDALEVLGDSHAIYGFSGDGRHEVEFHVAKDFRDPPSSRVWSALQAMQPRRSTRMGAAIRHAAHKLAREPMPTRVLLIVSDGYPQDRDYGPDRDDERYGIADTARALREAENTGIATFCLTIDPAGHDYLRRMCPSDHYMVIDDIDDLPAALSRVYDRLTGTAIIRRPQNP